LARTAARYKIETAKVSESVREELSKPRKESSTVHASSAKQGLARFTSCVLQSGVDLPYRAIKTNVGDSVDVVVHLERRPGRRFVSEVVEIHGYDPDRDEYSYGFIFDCHKELV
jgi:Flp pilus assembly CpaF family ATPase